MNDDTLSCWFCQDRLRTDPPAGGWLYVDPSWRLGHIPLGYGRAGTVILESRRHVVDQSAFDEAESATFVPVLGRALSAIRSTTGCDRVYQWATMDAFAHFHLWLIPWSDDGGPRGPRYLADTDDVSSDEECLAAASGLASLLA
jgi:hypothetical protein